MIDTNIKDNNEINDIKFKNPRGNVDSKFGKIQSATLNVQSLFQIDNFITFTKDFSLRDIISKTFYSLQEMNNGLCLLINTKKNLISDCQWNLTNSGNNIFEDMEDNMTASFVTRLIKEFKKSETNFYHVYRFNKGSDLQVLDMNDRDLKKKLIQYSIQNSTCNIEKAVSKLFNIEEDILFSEKKKYFLRLIILTGTPNSPINTDLFISTLNSYTNSAIFNSVVVNFLMCENDFYFNRVSKNSKGFIDYIDYCKEEDDSLIKSTKKLNHLLKLYQLEEAECKKISDNIFNFGRTLFNLNTKQNSSFHTLLLEFTSNFDLFIKTYIDFHEAVYNNSVSLKRKETINDQKSNIMRSIDEVIKQKMIDTLIDSIKKFTSEYYLTKNMKDLYGMEVASTITQLRESVEQFEKKIKLSGLSCIYWNDKINFMKNQIELIESTLQKILNLDLLFESLAAMLTDFILKNFR